MIESGIKPGALARLTEDTPPDWGKRDSQRKGFMFTVEEFVPAPKEGEADYGDPDAIQEDFYYGSTRGGYNNVCVPARIVEQAKSAEEMAARKIPTLKQASNLVSSGIISVFEDDADFFETSVGGPDNAPEVEAYGRTGEGLGFGMRVAVLEVWQTDD